MGVSPKQWLSRCQVVTSCFTKEKEEDCKCRLPCQELCFVSTEGGRKKKKGRGEGKQSSNFSQEDNITHRGKNLTGFQRSCHVTNGMYFAALCCDLNGTCEKSKLILHLLYPSKLKANTHTHPHPHPHTHAHAHSRMHKHTQGGEPETFAL